MNARARTLWCIAVAGLAGCTMDDLSRDSANARVTSAAPVAGYSLVRSWPHDPGAFTQGLELRGGRMYESTGGEGTSSLRETIVETGAIVRQVKLQAGLFGEGITILGDKVYQLTWKSQRGFVYDLASFRRTGEFTYAGEGWGLTNDGQSLIMSDGGASLRFLDPATFSVTRTLTVKEGEREVSSLNELEWVDGEIYANVWMTDSIVRIDPSSGSVTGWIDLEGIFTDSDRRRYLQPDQAIDVLNGIAYDDSTRRLFVTGKWWPRLYEITVDSAR